MTHPRILAIASTALAVFVAAPYVRAIDIGSEKSGVTLHVPDFWKKAAIPKDEKATTVLRLERGSNKNPDTHCIFSIGMIVDEQNENPTLDVISKAFSQSFPKDWKSMPETPTTAGTGKLEALRSPYHFNASGVPGYVELLFFKRSNSYVFFEVICTQKAFEDLGKEIWKIEADADIKPGAGTVVKPHSSAAGAAATVFKEPTSGITLHLPAGWKQAEISEAEKGATVAKFELGVASSPDGYCVLELGHAVAGDGSASLKDFLKATATSFPKDWVADKVSDDVAGQQKFAALRAPYRFESSKIPFHLELLIFKRGNQYSYFETISTQKAFEKLSKSLREIEASAEIEAREEAK